MMQEMIDFAESTIQENIENNYDAGRTTLCRQDFEFVNGGWCNGDAKYCTAFSASFPTENYSTNRFHFRHAETERTNSSIRAFATGLFGAGAQNVVYEDVPEKDWLLRPFDFCPAFTNSTTVYWDARRDSFQRGPEFEEVQRNVNRKLGFHGSNPLSFDTIYTMWQWCRYETAFKFELSDSEIGGDSVWCAPFSVADNLVFEYFDDIGHFYYSGYGARNQRMLENMNCGVMQNLLNLIDSDNTTDAIARIFVSHTQEIQSMLVLLGSFRDVWPMHEHNYAQQSGRLWLTSLIAQHAAVIRYDCDDDDDDLVLLLNERPFLVPGCDQQTGICKVSVFLNRFRRFIDANCEEFFCSND